VWLGGREVIHGRITLGQFVAFNAYLTMLAWPMIAFGWVTNMLQRGMAVVEADVGGVGDAAGHRDGQRSPAKADTPYSTAAAASSYGRPALAGRSQSAVRLSFAILCSPTRARRSEPCLRENRGRANVALVGVTGSGSRR
jgi:ATP-binding cassette subfamily B protein